MTITTALFVAAAALRPAVAQTCEPGQARQSLDANAVTATIFNDGRLFDADRGGRYNVPNRSTANSIYSANIWIGGFVEGELRFSGSDYGPTELWPGPLDADGNPPSDCSAHDRIYNVSRSDLSGNVLEVPDILDWPWQLGAPVEDGDGIPDNYDLGAGDRPRIEGDQMLWWIMNDAGGEHEWSQTDPLGIEVRASAFATAQPTTLAFTTFYRYEIVNRSGADIDSSYFGLFVDFALGNRFDDYVGTDTTVNMVFAYNGDDFDEGANGYGERPPALGILTLERDGASKRGITNTFFYQYPPELGLPANGLEAYYNLISHHRDGVPVVFCGRCTFGSIPLPIAYPGRPPHFLSEADLDGAGTSAAPGQRQVLLSTGPYDIPPDSSLEVDFAIVWARGANRFDSIDELRDDANIVKAAYRHTYASTSAWHDGVEPNERLQIDAYPNPVGRRVTLRIATPDNQHIRLRVVDLLGRDTALLLDSNFPSGSHSAIWNTESVPPGTYFAILEAGPHRQTQPIVVTR